MHDECLKEIYEHLEPEARKVFAVLCDGPDGHSIEELMQAARLTTHRVRTGLSELRGATLVTRTTPTRLMVNGERLRALLKPQADA